MKDNTDLTVPLAILTTFLGWQLWANHTQSQKLQHTLGICQQREQRTDQMIDKLRGFNE